MAIASTWDSLQTGGKVGPFYAVVGLSLLVAVPAGLRLRLPLAVATLVALTASSAGSNAGTVHGVANRGLGDVYATAPPFDAPTHHELYVLVVLAAAAFCLAVAVVAGSHPLVAAALIAAGMGWPTTVMPSRNTVATGAFCVIVALWPIAVAAASDRRELLRGAGAIACVAGAAIVITGVGGAKPSAAALDWQNWDLFGQSGVKRTVALIWNSDYGGVEFPREKTTVLRIEAPHRALYWRATTLDLFASHHWVESLYTTDVAGGNRALPFDGLLPRGAGVRENWVRQEVDVRAVVDDHVAGASQPMQIAAGAGNRIQYQSGGVMRTLNGLENMRRYTVWSYVARPTPAQLVRSPPSYPKQLARYLDVGRATMPAFGASQREKYVSSLFRDTRYQPLWRYAPVWRRARALTTGAQSPYQATLRIERWLRTTGGFGYDEHPPAPAAGVPPLVDFVQHSKLGYCQQFAGSMALMLRYLGIPARVAVGFTSGSWKDGTWTVTDHDAHAWVEAWFAGYGWLTFDPTPGRGGLTATYTNASDSADAIRALGTGRFLGSGSTAGGAAAPVLPPPKQPRSQRSLRPLVLPVAALALALLGLAAVKRGRRIRRGSSDDPRTIASAARADLVDFLRDQRSTLSPVAPIGELVAELRGLDISGDGFAGAYSRARYGPPDVAVGAAAELRVELRRVLALLRERLGAPRRALGFFTLRSLRGE